MSKKRFRIGFSFAGEKRYFVESIASTLASTFGEERILYDNFHKAEFARYDLGTYLPNLYNKQCELVVVIVCPDYDRKEWTGLEWTAIHDLIKRRHIDEVLLMRFGRADLKGLYSTAGFIELDHITPDQAATAILDRLAINEGRPKGYYSATISLPNRSSAGIWRRISFLKKVLLIAAIFGLIYFSLIALSLHQTKLKHSKASAIDASPQPSVIPAVTSAKTAFEESPTPTPFATPTASSEIVTNSLPKATPSPIPNLFTNSLGMKFIRLPGSRTMFGETPVTVGNFRHFVVDTHYKQAGGAAIEKRGGVPGNEWIHKTASWQSPGFTQSEDCPVVCVSWEEAESFCKWLGAKEGRTYRLPTDDEWTIAVGDSKYPWGDNFPPSADEGNFFSEHTIPVRAKKPNKLGFYDMGGNVQQWCEGVYSPNMISEDMRNFDPKLLQSDGFQGEKRRFARGSSWFCVGGLYITSAFRFPWPAIFRTNDLGFRCVLVLPEF